MAAAHYVIGQVYAVIGNSEFARKHFEQVLKLEPNNANAHEKSGILLTARFSLHEEGRKHLEQSVALCPDDAEANYNLGYFLSTQTKESVRGRRLADAGGIAGSGGTQLQRTSSRNLPDNPLSLPAAQGQPGPAVLPEEYRQRIEQARDKLLQCYYLGLRAFPTPTSWPRSMFKTT